MALYAFNCYDKDDNIYSIVAEVEYEDNDWFISYNAAWRNGEIISVVDVNKFNRDNGYQAFNRAIDEATEQGQSEVWLPVTDPTATLMTSAEKLKNKLSELSAILLFDLGIKDERFDKVMWAKNGLKYSGDLRQAVKDGWRIYGEVNASLTAPPVRVTVHEII